MGLKDFYFGLEEKYYNFLDWLDSKGIPLYKVDDWLHNKGIAGFPVFMIFCLIILALIVWGILALTIGFGPDQATVYLTFKDTTRNMLVEGLEVKVLLDSETTFTTDKSGKLSFVANVGSVIPLAISDPNYKLLEETVSIEENGQSSIIELEYKGGLLSKTIFFYDGKDETGQTLFSGNVDAIVTCTDNSSYMSEVSTSEGKATLSDISIDCGELVVTLSSPAYASETFSLDEATPSMTVEEEDGGFGNISITVLDADGSPKANASVQAMNSEYNLKAAQGITQASGVVALEVPSDATYYLVVSDLEGIYATEYTNSPIFSENSFSQSVGKNETISAIIKLNKKTVGSIKLTIKDTLGNLVPQAVIKVYKNGSNIEEVTGQLSEPGTFQFYAGENVPYRFVIDAENFMLEEVDNLSASESAYTVTLKPIKQSPELVVLVNGTDNEPVYNASVQLFTVDKQALLLTKTTDVAGGVSFNNLSAGKSYYVKVVKGNFSADSSPITLSGKVNNILTVKLNIGNGDLTIKAVNKDNLPVQGAEVTIYDIATDAKLNQAPLFTDETGSVYYTLRADRVVYVKIVKDSSVFYSLPIQADVDAAKEVMGYVYDKPANLGMDLISIYDLQGSKIESSPKPIVQGTDYIGYFLLRVPEGLAYDELGIFFKADDALILEKSQMYIKSLEFFNASVKMGTTYSPPTGFADDMQNLTSKEGLWAMASTTKVLPGNYLVKVVFNTTSAEKSLLSLNYRSWLKNGSTYTREPFDSELGTSSGGDKDGLYAKLNQTLFKMGNAVCSGTICSEVVVSGEGAKQKVVDNVFAKLNGIYNIDIIMKSISVKEYNNVTLNIESVNKGIDFKVKSFTIGGKSVSPQNKGTSVSTGGVTINSSFNASTTLEFMAMKEGQNIVKISLVGADGTVIYERTLTVDVQPSQELLLDIVPSTIVPYVQNSLSVKAVSVDVNEPIVGALANLFIEGKLISSVKTDYDGFALFDVPALGVGTKVMLQIMASGYKKVEQEIIVSENILMTDVPELTITIDRSIGDIVEGSVTMTNLTPLKLKIVKLYVVEGAFKEFLNFDFKKKYDGMFLVNDTNTMNIEYKAELTKGKNLLEPKEFETKMMIELEASGLGYKWNMSLPVKFYIKLAGGIDSTDCLKLKPLTDTEDEIWQILLSEEKEKTSMQFEIENSCKANSQDVYLYNPTIELVWKGKVLGEFYADSVKLGKKEIALSSETSGNVLAPGTTEIGFDFLSLGDVVSGKSDVTLRIKAQNPTNNGLQEVKGEAKAQVVISILKKCLQVVSAQGSGMQVNGVPVVILSANNYGMMGFSGAGYGMSSMMGYNSLGASSMLGGNNVYNTPYFTQTGAGLANRPGAVAQNNWAMNSANPNMAYQYNQYDPYSSGMYGGQGGYGNTMGGYGGNMGGYGAGMGYQNQMYGGASLPSIAALQIRNTCEFPVQIELQAMPQLWIESPSFNLTSGQTGSFKISATSMVGQYAVYVAAGVNNGLMLQISQIPVIVRDFMNETSNDCFVIEGGKKIDFTGSGITSGSIKQVRMWNKCYARGLTMDKAEPVTYNNLEAIDQITGQGKGTFYATAQVVESPEPTTYEGIMAEKFLVLFTKNLEIMQASQELSKSDGTLSGGVSAFSDLRKAGGQTYELVNMPALLTFKYNLSYVPRSSSILVYISDKMNILGALAKLSGAYLEGNKDCGPNDWDNYIHAVPEQLKVAEDVKNNMFSNNEYTSEEIVVMEVSKDCFGSMDSIKYFGNLESDEDTADGGAKIHVTIIPDDKGQNIVVKFRKPTVLAKGAHPVSVNFQGKVIKTGANKTKTYNFTLTATLYGDDKADKSSGTITTDMIKDKEKEGAGGEGGTTVSEAETKCYSLYGNVGLYLNNNVYSDIKYEWAPSKINDGFCKVKDDPYKGEGYFCDQYQFTAALSKSYNDIKTLFGDSKTVKEIITKAVNSSKTDKGFVKSGTSLLEYIGYLGGYDLTNLKSSMEASAKGGTISLDSAKKAVEGMTKCYFTDATGACISGKKQDVDRFYVRVSGQAVCTKAKTGATLGLNYMSVDSDASCYLKMTDILSADWGTSWADVAKSISTGQTVMLFYADDPWTPLEIERFITALGENGTVGNLTAANLRKVLFKANLMKGKYSAEFNSGEFETSYTIKAEERVKLATSKNVDKSGTYFVEIQKDENNFVFVPTLVSGTEKTEMIYNFPIELPVTKGRTITFKGKLIVDKTAASNMEIDGTAGDYTVSTNNNQLLNGVVFNLSDKTIYNNDGIKFLALSTDDLSKVGDVKFSVSGGSQTAKWVPKGMLVSSDNKKLSSEASGGATTVLYASENKSWKDLSEAQRGKLKYRTSTGDNYSGSLVSTPSPSYVDASYTGIANAFSDESRSKSKYCVVVDDSSIKVWVNDNWAMGNKSPSDAGYVAVSSDESAAAANTTANTAGNSSGTGDLEKAKALLSSSGFDTSLLPFDKVATISVSGNQINATLLETVCAKVDGLGTLVAGKTDGHAICAVVTSGVVDKCPGQQFIYGITGLKQIGVVPVEANLKKITINGDKFDLETDVMNTSVEKSKMQKVAYIPC
ncbi:MAG: carboxypeptidase-like regulatory domain-containing protein [Candidatus ainarchaeum sp.]|nr:carboxypeptidase-like regulatory domain-containing protein [Candidatus ainarchaeum sp.]